jgi:hypothetical protein
MGLYSALPKVFVTVKGVTSIGVAVGTPVNLTRRIVYRNSPRVCPNRQHPGTVATGRQKHSSRIHFSFPITLT